MRKMNEHISTTDIKTSICIKLLRVYLLYIKKRHMCKEIWRCMIGNR